jgi:hypothetical protein
MMPEHGLVLDKCVIERLGPLANRIPEPVRFPVSAPFLVAHQADTSRNLRPVNGQSLMPVRRHGLTKIAVCLREAIDRFGRIAHEYPRQQ